MSKEPITVYSNARPIPNQDLPNYTSGEIVIDWDANPLEYPVKFLLARSASKLIFRFTTNQQLGETAPRLNTFVEGLWNEDVFEVFLRDDLSGRYQEFNLSPSGAWWSAAFSDYRRRERGDLSKVQGVTTSVVRTGESAEFSLFYPFNELIFPLSLSKSISAHVCAILPRSGGENAERLYLSSSPIPGIKPDFHDARCFTPLFIQELF